MLSSKQILLNHVVSIGCLLERRLVFLECLSSDHWHYRRLMLDRRWPSRISTSASELGLALHGVMSDAPNSSSAFAQLPGSNASATGLKAQGKLAQRSPQVAASASFAFRRAGSFEVGASPSSPFTDAEEECPKHLPDQEKWQWKLRQLQYSRAFGR